MARKSKSVKARTKAPARKKSMAGKKSITRSAKSLRKKPVIVTVTDEQLKDIQGVASRLRAKGMNVERVLPVTGVIAGSSAPSTMAALKKVSGVMSVEEEVTAELPPPDSPVQ